MEIPKVQCFIPFCVFCCFFFFFLFSRLEWVAHRVVLAPIHSRKGRHTTGHWAPRTQEQRPQCRSGSHIRQVRGHACTGFQHTTVQLFRFINRPEPTRNETNLFQLGSFKKCRHADMISLSCSERPGEGTLAFSPADSRARSAESRSSFIDYHQYSLKIHIREWHRSSRNNELLRQKVQKVHLRVICVGSWSRGAAEPLCLWAELCKCLGWPSHPVQKNNRDKKEHPKSRYSFPFFLWFCTLKQ